MRSSVFLFLFFFRPCHCLSSLALSKLYLLRQLNGLHRPRFFIIPRELLCYQILGIRIVIWYGSRISLNFQKLSKGMRDRCQANVLTEGLRIQAENREWSLFTSFFEQLAPLPCPFSSFSLLRPLYFSPSPAPGFGGRWDDCSVLLLDEQHLQCCPVVPH